MALSGIIMKQSDYGKEGNVTLLIDSSFIPGHNKTPMNLHDTQKPS